MSASSVQCAICKEGVLHYYHWYEGCTCGAGGAREDHSSHCALAGVTLVHDDSLLKSAS